MSKTIAPPPTCYDLNIEPGTPVRVTRETFPATSIRRPCPVGTLATVEEARGFSVAIITADGKRWRVGTRDIEVTGPAPMAAPVGALQALLLPLWAKHPATRPRGLTALSDGEWYLENPPKVTVQPNAQGGTRTSCNSMGMRLDASHVELMTLGALVPWLEKKASGYLEFDGSDRLPVAFAVRDGAHLAPHLIRPKTGRGETFLHAAVAMAMTYEA